MKKVLLALLVLVITGVVFWFFEIPFFGPVGQIMLGVFIAVPVIVVFWLIITTVLARGHTGTPPTGGHHDTSTSQPAGTHSTYGATPAKTGGIWGAFSTALGILGIVVATILIIFVIWGAWGLYKAIKAPTTPATTRQVTTTERPWTIKEFDLSAEEVRVYLYPGWKDFPLLGKITIETPSGDVLQDAPGVPVKFGYQPPGWYTFHADPKGSKRGVRIYNQW